MLRGLSKRNYIIYFNMKAFELNIIKGYFELSSRKNECNMVCLCHMASFELNYVRWEAAKWRKSSVFLQRKRGEKWTLARHFLSAHTTMNRNASTFNCKVLFRLPSSNHDFFRSPKMMRSSFTVPDMRKRPLLGRPSSTAMKDTKRSRYSKGVSRPGKMRGTRWHHEKVAVDYRYRKEILTMEKGCERWWMISCKRWRRQM